MKLPKIIGHRLSRHEGIYENTLEGLKSVVPYADGVETDAVLSSDGFVFLVHDTLFTGYKATYELEGRLREDSRLLAGGRRIDQMTASEIDNLALVDGQKIPRLEDIFPILAQAPADFIVNLEIKAAGALAASLEKIKAAEERRLIRPGMFFFSSFNHVELLKARQAFPGLPIGMLYEPGNTQKTPMYPWLQSEDGDYTPFSLERLTDSIFSDINPRYICLNEYDLNPHIVKAIHDHDAKLKIFVWWYYSEGEPANNTRLFNTLYYLDKAGLGDIVAGVITDYPAQMKKQFENFTTGTE